MTLVYARRACLVEHDLECDFVLVQLSIIETGNERLVLRLELVHCASCCYVSAGLVSLCLLVLSASAGESAA